MSRFLCLICASLALVSCSLREDIPRDGGEPESLADPEMTVSGLISDRITSNFIFNLTLSSNSRGAIAFMSSDPSAAAVTVKDRRVYKVVTRSPKEDTPVTIRFVQDPKGKYAGAEAEVSFTVVADYSGSDLTAPSEDLPDLAGVKVSFTESTGFVVNPERGLYRSCDFNGKTGAISSSEIISKRLAGFTLWYMGFYLTDFMEGDISQEFLDKFQACMDALREGGSKCILRFAYKVVMTDTEDMEPEVDIVMRHAEQLKPYLKKNEDVIFVLQAGFVGPWGEWHSSTYFGSSFELRRQLLDSLLEGLPQSRQIQVRTPQFKMRMYGLSVKDTLTAATAHNGGAMSRIAGHNDCFGASANDYGTFDNEPDDREFWKADTRYTIMSGETCNLSQYCTCEATKKDLVDYHWTALNDAYNTNVLNRWKTSGCFNELTARLGYRLVLRDLFRSEKVEAGKPCEVTLRFYNTGYAAPMNPRDAVLVWMTPSGSLEETSLGSDPRTWQPGYHEVSAVFTPSSDKGTLYLRLSDPLLPGRPEYCISFANDSIFDSATGLNRLFNIQ